MRPIIWNDLDLLARKIAALHEEDRLPAAESIISRACYADAYRKRHGRIHAAWGNGSIMQVIGMDGPLPPTYHSNDPAYLRAMALVCTIFAERAEGHKIKEAA